MARPKARPKGQLYRLKDLAPPHYINGEILKAGGPPFALPEGVKPGKHLEPVNGQKVKEESAE
jgi:hypothetical protein